MESDLDGTVISAQKGNLRRFASSTLPIILILVVVAVGLWRSRECIWALLRLILGGN